ncbi:metallophosphoesterase [Adhaeribacter radiodurans]|uniref:metallophosphoesterase n=1 Tax=Adhaeribacter radiodurans TaxID=2745197 RepID=UPI00293BA972|nr:metallophosphoesterase [Adhaeribacter radiodurans]
MLLLLDWYIWQAAKSAFFTNSKPTRAIVFYIYWVISAMLLIGLWVYNFVDPEVLGRGVRTMILSGLFIIYCSKLFSMVFILIDDMFRFLKWAKEKVFLGKKLRKQAFCGTEAAMNDGNITRSEFLIKTALLATSIPAVTLTWGIISGAHDYRKQHVRLVIKNLPKAFEGMTIAQISDIHAGSFFNKVAVKGGVEMLIREKVDMVFFTGDLVNDRAQEVNDYIHIFNKIKAPLGVFSTLGNHDYGAYKG